MAMCVASDFGTHFLDPPFPGSPKICQPNVRQVSHRHLGAGLCAGEEGCAESRGAHGAGVPSKRICLGQAEYGYGTQLNHQGTAGFSPCFHLPGFHLGYLFLTHRNMKQNQKISFFEYPSGAKASHDVQGDGTIPDRFG